MLEAKVARVVSMESRYVVVHSGQRQTCELYPSLGATVEKTQPASRSKFNQTEIETRARKKSGETGARDKMN